jgi:aspartate kinase
MQCELLSKPIVVLKFGGAAAQSADCFAKIAEIVSHKSQEAHVVVVVSAMGDTTDQLLSLALQVHPHPPPREQDMLVSVGERISIALLAMALQLKGKEAISFTGSQSGIITSSRHADAAILEVKPHRILRVLERGAVAIVAGFQGVSREGEITTLGRGGSDTTAVALGAALGASKVEFYKDVLGIYSADPKKDPGASLFEHLSFDEMRSVLQMGSEVLHMRSVDLAAKNGLPLHVLSFEDPFLKSGPGTWIGRSQCSEKGAPIFETIL